MEKKKSIFANIPSSEPAGNGSFKGNQPAPPQKTDFTAELAPIKEEMKRIREENLNLAAELKKNREELLSKLAPAHVEYNKPPPPVKRKPETLLTQSSGGAVPKAFGPQNGQSPDFMKAEAKPGFYPSEPESARKKTRADLEKFKAELALRLKKCEEKTVSMETQLQTSADDMEIKIEELTTAWDKKFEAFKNGTAAAQAAEYKRVVALTKSLNGRMEELEHDYLIVLKNKLLLLETKAQLVETLSKKLEAFDDKSSAKSRSG